MSTPSLGRYGVSTLPPSSTTPERCRSFPNLSPHTAANEPSSVRDREVSTREPELNMKLPGHASGDTKKSLAEHSTSGTSSKVSVSNNDECHTSIAPDGRASLMQVSDGASGTAAVKDDASSSTTLKDDMSQELFGPEGVVVFDEMAAHPMVNEQELFNEKYWNDFNDDESFCGEHFEEKQPPKEMDNAVDFHLLFSEKQSTTSFSQISQLDTPSLAPKISAEVECMLLINRRENIGQKVKSIRFLSKFNFLMYDLIQRGVLGVNQPLYQEAELGTLYGLVFRAFENSDARIETLKQNIVCELSEYLDYADESNNSGSIDLLIRFLSSSDKFDEIEDKIYQSEGLKFLLPVIGRKKGEVESDNGDVDLSELLSLLRPVVRSNISQVVNDFNNHIGLSEFNQIEKLLLIHCLAICHFSINTDSFDSLNIFLQNPEQPDKTIWRTSFAHVIDKMLSPAAMLILHLVYWAMTIAHSNAEGHVSNNFPYENIIGTIMAVYCAVAITHGSLMNSVRIYRAGQSNPDGSGLLMWSSILLNTLKDATSLGGSVLSLIGIPEPIPLFQGANLMFSTIFAEMLIYRAKEANYAQFDDQKLKRLSSLIMLPALITGASSIGIPYLIPDICERFFGYKGGDTRFLMHSLRSIVSNLLTASNEGFKETNRIVILSCFSASIAITTWMFVDINRCEHPELKKELQSFRGYLTFRYLVTVFTALFSMAEPYKLGSLMAESVTAESSDSISKLSHVSGNTTDSPLIRTMFSLQNGVTENGSYSTESLLSEIVRGVTEGVFTNETSAHLTPSLSEPMLDHIVERVGALFVFLSTCDTGKGIIWEPSVGEFNRKNIKSPLREKLIKGLHDQFKISMHSQLYGVKSCGEIISIIVKALRDVGFANRLDKILSLDYEPEWVYPVYDTVRSVLTIHRTHNSGRPDLNEYLPHQNKDTSSSGLSGEAVSGAGGISIAGAKGVQFSSPRYLKSLRSSERAASETIPLLVMSKPELDSHQIDVETSSAHTEESSGALLSSSPTLATSGRFTIVTVVSDESTKAIKSSSLPPKPSGRSKSPSAKNDGSLSSEPSIGEVEGTDKKVAITVAHKPGKASHSLINIPESQGEGFSALPQSVAGAHVIDIENQDADFDNGTEEQGIISSSWSGKPDIFNDLPPEGDSRASK